MFKFWVPSNCLLKIGYLRFDLWLNNRRKYSFTMAPLVLNVNNIFHFCQFSGEKYFPMSIWVLFENITEAEYFPVCIRYCIFSCDLFSYSTCYSLEINKHFWAILVMAFKEFGLVVLTGTSCRRLCPSFLQKLLFVLINQMSHIFPFIYFSPFE